MEMGLLYLVFGLWSGGRAGMGGEDRDLLLGFKFGSVGALGASVELGMVGMGKHTLLPLSAPERASRLF